MNFEKLIFKYPEKHKIFLPPFKYSYEKIFLLACMYDEDINLIKDLINHYNIKNNSIFVCRNILFYACACNNNLSIIKFLLEKFLTLSHVSGPENLLLIFYKACSYNENLEIIKFLYENYIVTQTWYHPNHSVNGLKRSVINNTNVEITKYFINKKIIPLVCPEKISINFLAFENKNLSIIKFLMNFFPFFVCEHQEIIINTEFNEFNDSDNLNFIKELIFKHQKNPRLVNENLCYCHYILTKKIPD